MMTPIEPKKVPKPIQPIRKTRKDKFGLEWYI